MLQLLKNKILDSQKMDPVVADLTSGCRPDPRGLATAPELLPPGEAQSVEFLPMYNMAAREVKQQQAARPAMGGHRSASSSPRGSPRGSPQASPLPSPRAAMASPPSSPRGHAPLPAEADPEFTEVLYEGFPLSPVAAAASRFAFLPHVSTWAEAEHGVERGATSGHLSVTVKRAVLSHETDSRCRVRLDDGSGRTGFPDFETTLVKRSARPEWGSQFILSCPIVTFSLRLVVEMAGKGKAEFGSASVAVSDATATGQPIDLVLSLSAEAQVEIRICFVPVRPERVLEKSLQLEPLRLVLDRSVYFAGECVQGAVFLGAAKATRVLGVRMTARGIVRYQSSHNEATLVSNGSTHYDSILHRKRVHVFKEVVWLAGSEGAKEELDLAAISSSRSFRFWIPPSAPASMASVWPQKKVNVHLGHSNVRFLHLVCHYEVKIVVVTAGGLRLNLKTKLPFRVLQRYVAPSPFAVDCSMRFALQQDAPLRIRASLSSNELYPGTAVDLTVRLQNESTKKISRADVILAGFLCTTVEDTATLMGSSMLAALAGLVQGWTDSVWFHAVKMDLKSSGLLPVLENETKEARVRIDVPLSVNASVALPNGFMQWFVIVTCSYGLKKASAMIPVVVQPAVPEWLKSFPAPARLGVSDQGPLSAHFELSQPDAPLSWWALLPPASAK